MIRSVVAGCGAYLPARTLTNDELAQKVDTSDAWIVERTGIRERHVAAEGELTSDLARIAAERALADAGMAAAEVDLIVLATATPDLTFPATAAKVQAQLGIRRGAAFDIQAVCTGFIYALAVADNFLKVGQFKTALVIGAETFSRILDWNDRGTCVLFGDGAGAVVRRRAAPTAIAACSRRTCTPMAASTTCSMSMAARLRPARPASSAWPARKCSAMRWSIWPRLSTRRSRPTA
jgi:3-oxoacyl-[acyl-carrier-protein] synthase III